jgi:hypothetical protein
MMTVDQEGSQNSSETNEHYRNRNQASSGHASYSLAATFLRGLGVRISTHLGPLRNDAHRIS